MINGKKLYEKVTKFGVCSIYRFWTCGILTNFHGLVAFAS